jgi:hypothetical protein
MAENDFGELWTAAINEALDQAIRDMNDDELQARIAQARGVSAQTDRQREQQIMTGIAAKQARRATTVSGENYLNPPSQPQVSSDPNQLNKLGKQ